MKYLYGDGQLGGLFATCYVLGAVLAVLAVRRHGLFTAMIQPALILFVAVPSAYFAFRGFAYTGVKDALINFGYPLIERFPLMFFTSVAVLVIGALRLFAPRFTGRRTTAGADDDADEPARRPSRRPRARRSGRPDRPDRAAAAAIAAEAGQDPSAPGAGRRGSDVPNEQSEDADAPVGSSARRRRTGGAASARRTASRRAPLDDADDESARRSAPRERRRVADANANAGDGSPAGRDEARRRPRDPDGRTARERRTAAAERWAERAERPDPYEGYEPYEAARAPRRPRPEPGERPRGDRVPRERRPERSERSPRPDRTERTPPRPERSQPRSDRPDRATARPDRTERRRGPVDYPSRDAAEPPEFRPADGAASGRRPAERQADRPVNGAPARGGSSGTHHPVSRVRYRGADDGETRTEHRSTPRSRHAAPDSWEYDV